MYVELRAANTLDGSRGKTTWINSGSDGLAISLKTDKPEHLGRPEWYLEIQATDTRTLSSGRNGGDWKPVDYKLEIHLLPEDVGEIIMYVLKKNLMKFSVVKQARPKTE
jgi:hypothetical protein